MRQRYLPLLVTALLSALLAGCGSDSGFDEREDFTVGEGRVQFVNLMPDSPTVTMIHGIQNSAVRFPFAEAPEVRFEDRYNWRIAYLNNSNDDVTIIEGEDQEITENVLSTFLFFGTLDNPLVEIVDTPVIPAADRAEGVTNVWFASNSSQFDMVDIYLTDLDADLTVTAPLTTITSGTFTGLIEVPAAEGQQLRVAIAGTDELLFDSGAIVIPEKSQELFAIVDDFGRNGATHVDVIRSLSVARTIIRDRSQPGGARIGNFSSVAALDATYADVVNADVSAGNRTSYFDAGIGEFPYISADDDTTLEETAHTIRSGEFTTIYNFDDLSDTADTPVRSIIVTDERRPIAKRAVFKFINGSNEVVDAFLLRSDQSIDNSPAFLSDAPFSASLSTQVPPVNLNFIVRDADGDVELARASLQPSEASTYTAVFTQQQELLILED